MSQKQKYLDILRLEVEDLLEAIQLLESHYGERHAKGEITNYVLKENVALLDREIHGVRSFLEEIADVRAEDQQTLQDLVEDLETRLKKTIDRHAFDPVLYPLVDRKIRKVATYVEAE
jgi:hypothetical protein